jgi:hypothetical protein
MTLYSLYIYSVILFAAKNKLLFTANNEIHSHKIRNYLNFHVPTVNLTKFHKGPYMSGIKAYNQLPLHIKVLSGDMKCFKTALKRFLCQHSFYSIEEYYELTDERDL